MGAIVRDDTRVVRLATQTGPRGTKTGDRERKHQSSPCFRRSGSCCRVAPRHPVRCAESNAELGLFRLYSYGDTSSSRIVYPIKHRTRQSIPVTRPSSTQPHLASPILSDLLSLFHSRDRVYLRAKAGDKRSPLTPGKKIPEIRAVHHPTELRSHPDVRLEIIRVGCLRSWFSRR